MPDSTYELEKKLKHCQSNLKKAIDELYRIKKANKKKKKTNLSSHDIKQINKSINKLHKLEDKIRKK